MYRISFLNERREWVALGVPIGHVRVEVFREGESEPHTAVAVHGDHVVLRDAGGHRVDVKYADIPDLEAQP